MAPYRTVPGIERAAEVTLAADEVSEERWQQEIDRIHNFDTQWPFTQDRDWNQKSTAGAVQREEDDVEVSSAKNDVSEEAVAAGKGIVGCGEGGREGRREDIFTART